MANYKVLAKQLLGGSQENTQDLKHDSPGPNEDSNQIVPKKRSMFDHTKS
jgi:hypothetical protein